MNTIANIFSLPFGYLMSLLYNLTNNYIISILVVTLALKLCLLPFSINSNHNSLQQTRLRRKINAIKIQFEGDTEKIKTETQRLKEEHPMRKNRGCLTNIVQFFILVGFFQVINNPLTHIFHIDADTIAEMKTAMAQAIEELMARGSTNLEIGLLSEASNYKEALVSGGILSEETFLSITNFYHRFHLFGIDLSMTPKWSEPNELWALPFALLTVNILAAVCNYIINQKRNPVQGKANAIYLLLFLPSVLLFFISFSIPAGVCFYWCASNVLGIAESIILACIYNPNRDDHKGQGLHQTEEANKILDSEAESDF